MCVKLNAAGAGRREASAAQRKSSKREKIKAPLAAGLARANTQDMERLAEDYDEQYQSDPVWDLEADVLSMVQAGLERESPLTIKQVFAMAEQEVSAQINAFKVLDCLRALNDIELLRFDENKGEITDPASGK